MGSLLHVGNLAPSVTDDDLLLKFEDHGIVESAMITRDAQTGLSKQVACVVMSNDEEAQAAVDWLHLSQLEGRTISVTRINPITPSHLNGGNFSSSLRLSDASAPGKKADLQ